MKQGLSAILGGMALGLILAMGFGVTVGTRNSFARFSHAVRPGSKATLCDQSASIGIAWTEAASLVAVPLGAVLVWRQARRVGPTSRA